MKPEPTMQDVLDMLHKMMKKMETYTSGWSAPNISNAQEEKSPKDLNQEPEQITIEPISF